LIYRGPIHQKKNSQKSELSRVSGVSPGSRFRFTELIVNSETRIGTLEGQLYRNYDRSLLVGMSHLIGLGFPPMKVNNGAGVKSTLTDNPFVRSVLDACRIQGLVNSEVPSTSDEWIELLQHADTCR